MKRRTIFLYALGIIAVILVGYFLTVHQRMNITNSNNQYAPLRTNVDGTATFTYINSGLGMSSVIETNAGNIIVIDTGTSENDNLIQYLNGRTITAVVITAWDDQHAGNIAEVINNCPVKAVYVPESADKTILASMNNIQTPQYEESFQVDDVLIKFVDCQTNNIVPLVTHGMNHILYQGNQSASEASAMIENNEDMKNIDITGIILAGNGDNAFYSEDLLKKRPEFVLANLTLVDQTCSNIDTYVREHDINFYNFSYDASIPLHFTSTGEEIQFIGFE